MAKITVTKWILRSPITIKKFEITNYFYRQNVNFHPILPLFWTCAHRGLSYLMATCIFEPAVYGSHKAHMTLLNYQRWISWGICLQSKSCNCSDKGIQKNIFYYNFLLIFLNACLVLSNAKLFCQFRWCRKFFFTNITSLQLFLAPLICLKEYFVA